jgi:hypothetical protein
MLKCEELFFVWFMRSFYLAWRAMPQKLSQVVRESKTAILSQLPQ